MRHVLDDVHRVGVGRGTRGLEAAALVDGDVAHDGALLHARDHLGGDELRRPGAGDEHGADDDVGREHGALDLEAARHDELDAAGQDLLEMAKPVDGLVEDANVRPQAERDDGGVVADDAAPDHDDGAGRDARDTAEQQPAPTERLLEEVGAGLSREPPRHLAHRSEERQRTVLRLDGLVGDARGAAVQQRARQRVLGGEVQVGEEDLPVPQAVVLLGHRLLHLEEQVGVGPDFLHGGDACADAVVVAVRERAAEARARLDDHVVAALTQLARARGRQRDAVLVRFDLSDDADDQGAQLYLCEQAFCEPPGGERGGEEPGVLIRPATHMPERKPGACFAPVAHVHRVGVL